MIKEEKKDIVPVAQKYTLTITEASAYFNIGIKKLRHIAEEYAGELSIRSGSKYLIIRTKFEAFLANTSTI